MPWDPEQHGKRNLADHLNTGLPDGYASKAFRVQAPTELLQAFGNLTPEQRGRLLADAMRSPLVKGADQ